MKPNIDNILNKYWDGETSQQEELTLKEYFKSENISEVHLPFKDLFCFFDIQSSIHHPMIEYTSADIDNLLDKYWEGESTLEEEKVLKYYFCIGPVAAQHEPYAALFNYYTDQKEISYPGTTKEVQLKAYGIKRLFYAAAAVLVIVLGAVTVMNNLKNEPKTTQSAMVNEIQDPDEAMRVTKEALALVSSKFRESQQSVRQNIGALEKASIFK